MSPHAASAVVEVTAKSAVAALGQLLDDLADVVMTLDDEIYRTSPLPDVSGSVGEHVRHALDHIAALVASGSGDFLSYDHRERGTSVERDTTEALRQIMRLKSALGRSACRSLDEPFCVRARLSPDDEDVMSWSSFGRELAFVVNHTIHHQALIAVLLAVQGVGVDDRFGLAPSTPGKRS